MRDQTFFYIFILPHLEAKSIHFKTVEKDNIILF